MAKWAVEAARAQGVKAGLFRPITLWPFPIDTLAEIIPGVHRIVVVEAGNLDARCPRERACASAEPECNPALQGLCPAFKLQEAEAEQAL